MGEDGQEMLQAEAKEPINLNFNNNGQRQKNEECIRDALRRSLPASILMLQCKPKDIIIGIITILENYYDVHGPVPHFTLGPKEMSPQQKIYAPEIIQKAIKIMNRILVIDQTGPGKKPNDYFKMLLQKNSH